MKFKKSKMSSFWGGPRGLVVMVVVFVAMLSLLNRVSQFTRQVQPINYSKFLEQVESDAVKNIHVSGQSIQGEMKSGELFATVVPPTHNHWDLLKLHNVDVSVEHDTGNIYMWLFIIGGGILLLFAVLWLVLRQVRPGNSGNNMFPFAKNKAKMFMPSSIKENFDSVAGIPEAKEELKDIVDFLKDPTRFRRLGAKITRGALLVGEPGNGKTLLARAVAGEANCPFFSISGSDFIEVFVGVGASRVRELFAQARRHAPSIIFIDELDAVGRQRGAGLGGGHDEREQTLNQLLTEMDGFQTKEDSVIVLAATNRPDVLDKALLRPGRFDRRVYVPFPDLASREQILNVHIKNVTLDPAVDVSVIAKGTPGFSGADLASLINEAALAASKKDQDSVVMHDFEEARDKIILGKEVKSMVRTKEEMRITAYHEAGHALLTLLQPEDADPLHKVTIAPRGRALGVSFSFPERDKHVHTKKEIIAKIIVSMGGRAAEELMFNTTTTGASNDFKVATSLARTMVCHCGMSGLGKANYSQESGEFVYSQKTAEEIDREVNKVLDSGYDKAMEMLRENQDKLVTFAEKLFEQETMYAGEIYELLGIPPRQECRFV